MRAGVSVQWSPGSSDGPGGPAGYRPDIFFAVIAWGVGSGERRLAGEHLVHHAGQRIDVGAAVDLGGSAGLLGAHVCRGADHHVLAREPIALGLMDDLGDPEVGEQQVVGLDQQVLGLDVAVDDALGVEEAECLADFAAHSITFGTGSMVSRRRRSRRLSPSTKGMT